MVWKNDQVSRIETEKILEIARRQLGVKGDFVEMGCYRGDTSLMLAEVLRGSDKRLWIYDSFEGLPEKSAQDYSEIGVNFRAGELAVSKREVKERFLRAGLKLPVIKKGWFGEFLSEDLPKEVSFAFLDGDFYESTRDALRLIDGCMVKNGVILVHDYGNLALPGVAVAVDEWAGVGIEKKIWAKVERFESLAMISKL